MDRRRALVLAVFVACAVAVPATARASGTGKIGGSVFQDLDRNGVRGTGEVGFASVQLLLFDGTGANVAVTVTDSWGRYLFSGLVDGTYRVEVSAPSWWDLRETWVPSIGDPRYPSKTVALVGTAAAPFGWRPIVRSTTLGSPISSYTGSNGLRVESYDDVVAARDLYDALMLGTVGPEASTVMVRFDSGPVSSTVVSAVGTPGSYTGYYAASYVGYDSWLDGGDTGLSHEYGHAWSWYNAYMVQQTGSLDSYLQARGLAGDPRVNTSYAWSAQEMIAEDYRQLLGSPTARLAEQMNRDIPPAADVPGLADFLANTFTQPPPAPPPPPPPPPPTVSVTSLAVTPVPVTKVATVAFGLTASSVVTVTIRAADGTLVRTLLSGASEAAGPVAVTWDRKDSSGRRVRSGTYTAVVAAAAGSASATASASFVVA